jgi:hypothetical protein
MIISLILNLTPILPNVSLSDYHTGKKNNMLFDYIKIPEFVCKTMPSNKEEIFFWDAFHWLPEDKLYLKHKKEIHEFHKRRNKNQWYNEKFRASFHDFGKNDVYICYCGKWMDLNISKLEVLEFYLINN